MDYQNFPNGLTVKELKELIKDWPETYENGEPTEVWIETAPGISNVVTKIVPLNFQENSADIIFESGMVA